MSDQLSLIDPEPKLTDRQQYALGLVQQDGGATAAFVGLAWHARRGKHNGRHTCEWCETDGHAVLVELRKKGLVTRRRSGLWEPRTRKPPPAPATSKQTNVIPY